MNATSANRYKCPQKCTALTANSITMADSNYGNCTNGGKFSLIMDGLNPTFKVITPCPRCSLKAGEKFPAVIMPRRGLGSLAVRPHR